MNENELILERLALIFAELDERLSGELTHNDLLALRSAVSKAAVAGFNVGAGHVAWGLHLYGESVGVPIRVDVNYLNDTDFDPYEEEQASED